MTLIDIQRRIAEVGRIRIGEKVPTSGGKSRPAKLETFRLTSADRGRIEAAARLYGGAPEQWDAPAGRQWQVTTDTDTLPVIVPPSELAFSQHYEQWAAGGCQVRCDGQWDTIADRACHCDPDARACAPHTRLSVLLRDVPGLGVWRLDSQGYYAATELQGAMQIIALAAAQGAGLLPAQLRLEQRTVKRQGEGTRRFAVPVLDIDVTPAQLLSGGGGVALGSGSGSVAMLDRPAPEPEPVRLLTPVPDSVPERPVGSVADQVAAVESIERRRRGSVPVPATGVEPRPVEAVVVESEPVPPPEPLRPSDPPSGDVWAELATVLGEGFDGETTMPTIQAKVRRLFEVMETARLWLPTASGQDALHAALAKRDAAHLSDLKKAELVSFARAAFAAAAEAWNATEEPEEQE